MPANVIFRGPLGRQPETVNRPVAGAYLPGILVTDDGSEFTVAAAADMAKDLLLLSNLDLAGQDVATAYTSGDTGRAYRLAPEDIVQVRLAAATYAKGDPLTVGTSGYLEATSTSERVIAYFDGTAGVKSAGDLDDVRIANSFLTAAA